MQAGRQLGEFVLVEPIGGGGGGIVFRAFQPSLDRHAVVKLLDAATPAHVARFMREARLASRLDHPYAAHVYAFGEDEQVVWIAMELVRGTPLSALLEQGAVPDGSVLLQRICEVVHACHELGIVHGDLKPSNIMVVARGGSHFPKLIDFGIARDMADNTVEHGVGTPQYMAPEQWVPGGVIAATTDIYALGALAYELLAGQPAFAAETRMRLAKLHASAEPPALPPSFPVWLNAALARAMAKDPAARFQTAAELGSAVAGPAQVKVNVPRLDRALRDDALLKAPEPLAHAVAALDSATNELDAYRAAWQLAGTVAHYIGALALACRLRVRSASDEAATLLDTLRERGLDMGGWWVLARELVRPFVEIRDAYPIPELVDVFFDGRAELTTALDLLGSPLADASSESIRAELPRIMPILGDALRAVAGLAAYRLAVPSGRQLQAWHGTRRAARELVELAPGGIEPRGPMLVGDGGIVSLALSPIVVAATPLPGVPRELFFLAGPGRQGARGVTLHGNYEHSIKGVWRALGLESSARNDADERIAPYRGLSAFTETDAAVFFGREREIEEALNRVRSHRWLALVGPSGSGKSSFVRAGLVPALGWTTIVLRPGTTPIRNLLAACGAELRVDDVVDRPDELVEAIVNRAGASNLLVYVDQFEELFTLTSDPSVQQAFATALLGATELSSRVRCVITLRDDFLVRAAQQEPLSQIGTVLQIVTTPAPPDLLQILVEPARRRGYSFEDDSLPEQIVAEVADRAGALALVSFTAAKLWELRDRTTHQLTRKAYRALGGVGGALAQHAEAVLAKLDSGARGVVRELFRHLVTADGTRTALTRDEAIQVAGGAAVAAHVLETLIAERLLTAMEFCGAESIEVIHETLLASWPRLVQWRAEDVEHARQRDQLRAAARQWDDRARPRGMLWRSDALVEYRLWRKRFAGSLTVVEEAFGAASIAEANRGRQLRRTLTAVTFAALATALVIFMRLRGAAETAQERAQTRLAESYLEEAGRAMAVGDAFAALVYLDGAAQLGVDSPNQRFMVARAAEQFDPEIATLAGHRGAVRSIRIAADGTTITLGADGTLRGWAVDGTPRWNARAYAEGVDPQLALDPSGAMLATSGEQRVELWDVTGRRLRRFAITGDSLRATALQFSPDGSRLAIAASDGTARIWELATGAEHLVRTNRSLGCVIGWGGDQLIVGEGNSFRVWAAGAPPPEAIEITAAANLQGSNLQRVALSPDGRWAAIGLYGGDIELWDVRERRFMRSLVGHEGMIWTLHFVGDVLVSSSSDDTSRVWSFADGGLRHTLRGHRGTIIRSLIDVRGRLVTTSLDGTARIWDLVTGVNLRTFAHGGLLDLAVSPDASRIATGSNLGTAKLWRTDSPVGVDQLEGAEPGLADSPWISGDGTRLARTTPSGIELWDLTRRSLVKRLVGPESFFAGGRDHLYVIDGKTITALRARDGYELATFSAPESVAAACTERATEQLVVGGASEIVVFALDGTAVARARATNVNNIACARGVALAIGDAAIQLTLPDLRVIRKENPPFAATMYERDDAQIPIETGRNELSVWMPDGTAKKLVHSGVVQGIATHGDTLVVGVGDGRIVEYDTRTWTIRREFRGHQSPIVAAAVASTLYATLGADNLLRVWSRTSTRALLDVRLTPGAHWIRIVGEQLLVGSERGIESRRLDLNKLDAPALAAFAACRVPMSLRELIGGPPPAVPCSR